MKILIELFSILLLLSCSNKKEELSFLQVKDSVFVDGNGQQIILNGINHVVKNPKTNYINPDDKHLFKDFRKYGFNCIRYGIVWDGLEPEPGVINQKYLQEIDKRVQWAEENGIYLILDMHQDLFSRKYSDGAPEWATLSDSLPHQTGDVWSDAYLLSPAVQRAFDNFWSNKPAKDGIGIQDHYIHLWEILAKRYADSPSVAGFDIMNEPFMGSIASRVFEQLLQGYADVLAQKGEYLENPEHLVHLFGQEKQRIEMLKKLDDKVIFRQILKSASKPIQEFEENTLSSFYQKARNAIRKAGSQQILFLEHNYFCNMGIPSYFHVPKQANGENDPNCAYAPHGYDLVTDTEALDKPGYNRTEVIFEQLFTNAKNKNLPIWIGEWGAFYMGKNYLKPAMHITNMIEEHLCGQTYWCWWENIETQDYFHQALSRNYPISTEGKLIRYNNQNGQFFCQWECKKHNASVKLFIPQLRKITDSDICISTGCSYQRKYIGETNDAGYIIINSPKGYKEIKIKTPTTTSYFPEKHDNFS